MAEVIAENKYFRIVNFWEDGSILSLDIKDEPFERALRESRYLELSIKKWKFISETIFLTAKYVKDGSAWSCGLCRAYNGDRSVLTSCMGCPVREKTGKQFCYGTPYYKYSHLLKIEEAIDPDYAYAYAAQEYNFLKGLKDNDA